MPDKIPAALIKRRHKTFMTRQAKLHRERLKRWIGKELPVLVDAQQGFDRFLCRHAGQAHEVDAVTRVDADGLRVGDWAQVRIAGIDGYDLVAEKL
jgi:tRNA A37 methylthiotransferase MiaB